jgi:tetratricopeptide (TPR) repeat protein
MLLHQDLSHFFNNTVGLFVVGPLVALRMGSRKFLTVYLLSSIVAGTITQFDCPIGNFLGASAAINGLGGACLALLQKERRTFNQILWWILIILLLSYAIHYLFYLGLYLFSTKESLLPIKIGQDGFNIELTLNWNDPSLLEHGTGFLVGYLLTILFTSFDENLKIWTSCNTKITTFTLLACLMTIPIAAAYQNSLPFYKLINLRDKKDYATAIHLYKQAIKLRPYRLQLHQQLAYTQFQMEKYEEVISTCSTTIKLNPTDVWSYCYLGKAYAKLKKYPKAIENYSKAINIVPEYGEPYYNRAIAYKAIGKPKLAEKDLAKVKELNYEPE